MPATKTLLYQTPLVNQKPAEYNGKQEFRGVFQYSEGQLMMMVSGTAQVVHNSTPPHYIGCEIYINNHLTDHKIIFCTGIAEGRHNLIPITVPIDESILNKTEDNTIRIVPINDDKFRTIVGPEDFFNVTIMRI